MKNNHDYHLYAYNDIKNVPKGTTVKDGNEILPQSMIFSYNVGEGRGSFSAFSNYFRYKLLLERGGWWSDTDVVCLKPFDFEEKYVFSSEYYEGKNHVTSSVIRAPSGSEAMENNWKTCESKNKETLPWGEVGPRLVSNCVDKYNLEKYVKDHKVFCPLGFEEWHKVLNPNISLEFGQNTYAIHMWNEMWRRSSMDKNKKYNSSCLYERLKNRYA